MQSRTLKSLIAAAAGLMLAGVAQAQQWKPTRPINLIVLVITVVEALRAFDIVWVVNRGRNGLELIATLVTQNIVGEASRIGFGSALATMMLLISSVFVVIYLRTVMKEDR